MVLIISDLSIQYNDDDGAVYAVDDVSCEIDDGEIVGLLGESGGGKSTLAKSLVRDLDSNAEITAGEIVYEGTDLLSLSEEEMRKVRWDDVAYVPQNAMNCLDPVYTIEEQMTETIGVHRDIPHEEEVEMAKEVFDIVGIEQKRLKDYPHEMSGGMKQRIVLALSLILEPELIIADEPTTGLDVLLRDKILADIERYRDEFDISVLIVSHDIADLVETCDRLMVMYGGNIVEKSPSRELIEQARHPYTMGLKNSLPTIESKPGDLIAMDMEPPDLRNPPEGCIFVNKCPYEVPECHDAHPEFDRDGENEAACYRADEHESLEARIDQHGWHDAETMEEVTNVEQD
ncbi:MAG: oligopeptide/dipeptide ABC transporter ATP-binding protein [Natronomonas sp.]|jgi:oligopeptide/dipeptide ABC transporter ATP-binding protein